MISEDTIDALMSLTVKKPAEAAEMIVKMAGHIAELEECLGWALRFVEEPSWAAIDPDHHYDWAKMQWRSRQALGASEGDD